MKWSVRKVVVGILIIVTGCVLLGVVSFVVRRVRLEIDIARQLAAIRAAGLPTNAREANNYYTPVPDNENVAWKMAEAFASMTNYIDGRSNEVASIEFPVRTETLTPKQLELMTGYIAMNSDALACARAAIKLPRCRYPIDLSLGAATPLPHLPKLRAICRIAEFQSLIDTNKSSSDISMIIEMSRTLDNEPIPLSKLVRIAMLNKAEMALERRLNAGSLNEANLDHLEKLFAEAVKTNQLANGLIGERALYLPYFRMSVAEINKLADYFYGNSAYPPLPGSQPFVFKLIGGFFERDLRFYLQAMTTNISLAQTFPMNISLIRNVQYQIRKTSQQHSCDLSAMLLPALAPEAVAEAREVANGRLARTALAVEHFRLTQGRLPKKLDELVPQFLSNVPADPFDGRPLQYRLLAKGYVIYSVDSDGHDDGGHERPVRVKATDKTSYDIALTVRR